MLNPMLRTCRRLSTGTLQCFVINTFIAVCTQKIDWSEAMIDRAYEEAEETEEEALEEAREKRRVPGNRPMVYGPIPGTRIAQLYVRGLRSEVSYGFGAHALKSYNFIQV